MLEQCQNETFMFLSFPNYPNVVPLFIIISLTEIINKTAKVYSRWANKDRNQSMGMNAQINWFSLLKKFF